MSSKRYKITSCRKFFTFFIDNRRGERETQRRVENWLESMNWQAVMAWRRGDCSGSQEDWAERRAGGEKAALVLKQFCSKRLTIFGGLEFGALVLPNDGGRRRADHVADDVGVVALVELLWTRRTLEGDLFCWEVLEVHLVCCFFTWNNQNQLN